MIKIHDEKLIDFDICEEFYKTLPNRNFCFYDIETTGFSGAYNKVVLIGVLYLDKNKLIIEQFFSEDDNDELNVLLSALNLMSKFDTLISYNGDTFDIPFINKRLKHLKQEVYIDKKNSLDLLKVVRKNKSILNLNDCKLKSVEKSLGIHRIDQISGKDSVKLYEEYLLNPNNALLETILRHNYDDIYYLPQLLNIYSLIFNKKYFNADLFFNGFNTTLSSNLDVIDFSRNSLTLDIVTESIQLPNYVYYSDFFNVDWKLKDGLMNIKLSLLNGKLSNGNSCKYVNLNLFDYELNVQDSSNYELPTNIILIKEKSVIHYENLKILLSNLLKCIQDNCL